MKYYYKLTESERAYQAGYVNGNWTRENIRVLGVYPETEKILDDRCKCFCDYFPIFDIDIEPDGYFPTDVENESAAYDLLIKGLNAAADDDYNY